MGWKRALTLLSISWVYIALKATNLSVLGLGLICFWVSGSVLPVDDPGSGHPADALPYFFSVDTASVASEWRALVNQRMKSCPRGLQAP